jgi:hypothetical protein
MGQLWSDWQQAHTALEADAEWLATSGWTIPMWRDPQIVNTLRTSTGSLDAAFVAYYTRNRSAKLDGVWADLLASDGLRHWRPLLEQSMASYRDRRYAVVIPALLLIVEGAVARGAADFRRPVSSPKPSADRKRKDTPAGMRRLIWASIDAFVRAVFDRAPFDQSRPAMLNRHWILHGRELRLWARRRECIRLFHALHTISTVVNLPR